jgi:hypothetical protein
MDIHKFIGAYDFEGAIVLLEGKRTVKTEDKELLINLGKLLTSSTKYIQFRSGNAPGADELFCQGVSLIDPSRIQLVIPNKEHRKKNRIGIEAISLDEINILNEPEIIYQSKSNLKTKNLIERYISGHRDYITNKATYIIRDTIKVIGTSRFRPANYGIFYDDLDSPFIGGTGHSMKVCKANNVPFINQNTWKNWLL